MTPPTVAELNANIIAQLEDKLAQTIPIFPKAFLRVLAKVLAGVVIILFKYAGFIFLQLFVAHASMEWTTINGKRVRPLVEWGRLIGIGDPIPAVPAELVVSVPVTTQTGSLKAGTKLIRDATRVVYEVQADVPLNAASVQARIVAVSIEGVDNSDGSGEIGNLAAGDVVSFVNTPANVASATTVVSTTVNGAEAETADAYRARIIDRFQKKPQGGAYADYQMWAEEVPEILHAYPYAGADVEPALGGPQPGTVWVFVESETEVDGIPTDPQRDAVLANINKDVAGVATRRPVNDAVYVRPIRRTAFDVNVEGLAPDTPELQVQIEDAVSEYFTSREPFIEGLSVLPRTDRITEAGVSGVVDGIVNANGASVNGVTLPGGAAYTLGAGEKAKRGSVNFI